MRYFGREFGGLAFRLKRFLFGLSALLVGAAATTAPLAPTPPMGWNSWDAYGFTISEAQFKANVALLAKMRPLGWNTAVIDEG
jgi:alpha-galactosidase